MSDSIIERLKKQLYMQKMGLPVNEKALPPKNDKNKKKEFTYESIIAEKPKNKFVVEYIQNCITKLEVDSDTD